LLRESFKGEFQLKGEFVKGEFFKGEFWLNKGE
jgi:hypothetical protein